MKHLNNEIINFLKTGGAELIHFIDISYLGKKQNRGLPNAIVFALPLTATYLVQVFDTPDYIQARIDDNYNFDDDEYLLTENKAGEMADKLAQYLTGKRYNAISQSDTRLFADGMFDSKTKESVLPHKTVALLGGLGWIGKNNLLITPEYGAAQCLGSVLTDVPLETILHKPPLSKCGNCSVCVGVCEQHVLKGKCWLPDVKRDEIVNVHGCSTCLKCLVHCLWTRKYVRRCFNH